MRVGRFRIEGIALHAVNGDLDSQYAKNLMGLMGQMIIIRALNAPNWDAVDYYAMSPLFDDVAEGAEVPWYEIEFQTIDHGPDYAEDGHAHQYETIAQGMKRKPPGETWA